MGYYSMVAFAVLGVLVLLTFVRLDKIESQLLEIDRKLKEERDRENAEKTEQNEKIQELLEEFESVKSRLRVKKPQR